MNQNNHKNEKSDKFEKRISKIESIQIVQENRLFKIINNIYKYGIEEPNKVRFHQASKSLIYFFLRRQMVVIMVSSLAGILSFVSLYVAIQSKDLLSDQNDRIIQQNQLLEADRRSSLVFLFNNILDALDNELKKPVTDKSLLVNNKSSYGKITKQLAGRIIAISRRLKPYKLYDYETDSLTTLVSPERGQLLINLLESNLDTISLSHIYNQGDFSYAQLDNYTGTEFFLNGINLSNADLSNCQLIHPSFVGSNLNSSNLEGALLSYPNLTGASLENADLKNSSIIHANARGINLKKADLANAAFAQSNLIDASFVDAKMDSVRLLQCDLENTLFYRFHKDTIISNTVFMNILKHKKIMGWEEINQSYELSKRTIPLVEIKNGKKTINLIEKINLRTDRPHPITYDFRLRKKSNWIKPTINFYKPEYQINTPQQVYRQ